MRCCVVWGISKQSVSRFSNYSEVTQHRILKQCVRNEIGRRLSGGVSLDSFESAEHVFEVILGAFRMLAHTGWASSRTLCRNFSGRHLGVSRSTLTPVRASISICKPAKSSKLVFGEGSTNRSR